MFGQSWEEQEVVDLSGDWAAESTSGSHTYTGELTIQQTGSEITATSTIGGSNWTGHFDGKTLEASFTRPNSQGNVVLHVSKDGESLEGTWTAVSGAKGKYSAKRKNTK